MLVVTNSGTLKLAAQFASLFTSQHLECRLFDNDIFPTIDSVLGDFHEASFPGYHRFVVPKWAQTGLLPGPHNFIQGVSPTFSANTTLPAQVRIFGYHIYWVQNAIVLFAERFPRRFFMRGTDTPLTFSLRLGLLSEFSG